MIKLLRKSKVQRRLMISFLLLAIIPLCTFGFLAYHKSNEAITSKTTTFVNDILRLLGSKIGTEVAKYETFADQIMLNGDIQQALLRYNRLSDLDISNIHKKFEDTVLSDKFWLFATIKTLQILTNNGQVLYDYGYEEFTTEDKQRIFALAKQNKSADIWTTAHTTAGDNILSLARRIPLSYGSGETVGFVIMGIDEELFSQILFGSINMGQGSEQIIMNDAGEILTSNNHLFHSDQDLEANRTLNHLINSRMETGIVTLRAEPYFFLNTHNEVLHWNVISLIPQAYLNMGSVEIRNEMFFIAVICVVVSSLFATFISISISTPLKKLVSGMNQVMRGDLKVEINDKHPDEIGYLSGKFEAMIEEIKLLIERVEQEQAQKRGIELQMLQAQINPHFLFNTLSSLKWTAMLSQADSVSNGLGALAELLRSTIVQKNERITLGEELRNIKNYVVIQQIRYGMSLQVDVQIPEQLLDTQVLKFLLQPIVENSIIHGLSGENMEPRITMTAELNGVVLKIKLSDNGKGMSAEKLQEILQLRDNHSENRLANIGIGNVRERIKLHYGDPYGLEIWSKPDQGTDVIITIPYISTLQEDSADADTNCG
ncbi:two-component system sensor histidine kinase YesM [Paenibacillus sp. PastF-3]|uniref:cache domain-containing sensor histidine kinase n=1 Tax=Paenibacillus sp. PastF-3 TaxID=2940626 RepID=UPI002472E9CD|nr:sensor histidine kinase [Paenibacillus sp. PastF-3]MDH6369368.1 two-component system sensor histidine kinase YesM [Paenibacillus sp. PastF-3]